MYFIGIIIILVLLAYYWFVIRTKLLREHYENSQTSSVVDTGEYKEIIRDENTPQSGEIPDPDNLYTYPIPSIPVPSFKRDIRILFRPQDIVAMRWKFNLADYEEVKIFAEPILQVLKQGTMPKDKPWEKGNVELFQRWILTGCMP